MLNIKSFCLFVNGICGFIVYNTPRLLCNTQIETLKDWAWYESRRRDARGNSKSMETVKLKMSMFTASEVLKKNGQLKMMWICVYMSLKCLKRLWETDIYFWSPSVCSTWRNAEWRLREGQNKTVLFSASEMWRRRENCSFPCFCESENRVQTPFRPLFT